MSVKLRHYEPMMITLFRFGDALLAGATLYLVLILFTQKRGQAIEVSLMIALLTLVVFTYTGVYRSWRTSNFQEEIKRILKSCIIVYTAYIILLFFLKLYEFHPRVSVLGWMCLWPLILFVERLAVRSFLWFYRKKGRNIRSTVIAGTGKLGINLARWINENPWSGTRILGFFNGVGETEIEGYPVLGSYKDLPDFVRKNNVDTVYIALPLSHIEKMKQLVDSLRDSTTHIYFLPDVFFYEYIYGSCVNYIDNIPVISLVDSPMQGFNSFLKRVEDIVLASIILIIISPVMIFAAVCLKLTSPGSILFKQWRYGINGERICVWKFRTMTVTEDGYNFNQVTKSDPRVTPFGTFLRRTSIDELPQFFNVLQGSMSIVGPRPHAISMVDDYRKKFDGAMQRHLIRPGITGLAQIYGTRGTITDESLIEKRIYYDMKYIKEWSLFLDLKIIILTIITLFHKVAY